MTAVMFTKDWCMRMAGLEGDSEIGAGLVAIDPTFRVNRQRGFVDIGRAEEMRRMRGAGSTLQSIADEFGISRQRVFQILTKPDDQVTAP